MGTCMTERKLVVFYAKKFDTNLHITYALIMHHCVYYITSISKLTSFEHVNCTALAPMKMHYHSTTELFELIPASIILL